MIELVELCLQSTHLVPFIFTIINSFFPKGIALGFQGNFHFKMEHAQFHNGNNMKDIVVFKAWRVFNSENILHSFWSIKSLNRETTIQNNQFSKNRCWIFWGYRNESALPLNKWKLHEITSTVPLIKVTLFVFSTARSKILDIDFFKASFKYS